jgi:hypothetical protein
MAASTTGIKNQILIQEYIELKRITNENSSLAQNNESLIKEIANLEVKLSELEAKLEARENELKCFEGKFPNDIDTQIKILEIENKRLKQSINTEQNETWKNEIAQNLKFKDIYETSYKEILQKFNGKNQENHPSCVNNSLENEKNKLAMQLTKQKILLQEGINDKTYIKNNVLPVLEHTLHLYEKNKLDLDSEIDILETKLKITSEKKPDNIIYEEDEFDVSKNDKKCSRESSLTLSPKQSLQYSFVSLGKLPTKPSLSKVLLTSPRAKLFSTQIKNKKQGKK